MVGAYATVDERLNTGLTLGVAGFIPWQRVRPFLRAFFIHQHEEGLVAVEEEPLGVLVGIGAGIRHRAGLGGTLGLEIPFKKSDHVEYLAFAGGTVTASRRHPRPASTSRSPVAWGSTTRSRDP